MRISRLSPSRTAFSKQLFLSFSPRPARNKVPTSNKSQPFLLRKQACFFTLPIKFFKIVLILKMKNLGAAKKSTNLEFRWGKASFGSTLYPPPQNSLRLDTPLGRLMVFLHKSSKVMLFEKHSAFQNFLRESRMFSKAMTLDFLKPKNISNGSTG